MKKLKVCATGAIALITMQMAHGQGYDASSSRSYHAPHPRLVGMAQANGAEISSEADAALGLGVGQSDNPFSYLQGETEEPAGSTSMSGGLLQEDALAEPSALPENDPPAAWPGGEQTPAAGQQDWFEEQDDSQPSSLAGGSADAGDRSQEDSVPVSRGRRTVVDAINDHSLLGQMPHASISPVHWAHSTAPNPTAQVMLRQWCVDGLWSNYAAQRAAACAKMQEHLHGGGTCGSCMACGSHGPQLCDSTGRAVNRYRMRRHRCRHAGSASCDGCDGCSGGISSAHSGCPSCSAGAASVPVPPEPELIQEVPTPAIQQAKTRSTNDGSVGDSMQRSASDSNRANRTNRRNIAAGARSTYR